MELISDLNSISETIAQSKSVVKESLDLTQRNLERKKEIERRLKNCFACEDSFKYLENSFTIDLENPQLSMIHKERNLGISKGFHNSSESQFEDLNNRIKNLVKENEYTQKKFEEMQDILQEVEEENLKLKHKIKVLVGQTQNENNEKNEKYEKKIRDLIKKIEFFEQEYEKCVAQKCNYMSENTKLAEESNMVRAENQCLLGKIKDLQTELLNVKEKLSKKEEKTVEICTDSSTENYLQYFKNLKSEILEVKKKKEENLSSRKEISSNPQEKLEIDMKIKEARILTPKYFQKVKSLLENSNEEVDKEIKPIKVIPKPKRTKKLSISYENIKANLSENKKPKAKKGFNSGLKKKKKTQT